MKNKNLSEKIKLKNYFYFKIEKIIDLILSTQVSWFFISLHFLLIFVLPLYRLIIKVGNEGWNLLKIKALNNLSISTYIISIKLALFVSIINTIVGSIFAWILSKYEFPGKFILDTLVDMPLSIPTTVAGIALTMIYGKKGFFKTILFFLKKEIIYTKKAAFLAMIFASFPYSVRSIQTLIKSIKLEQEQASISMGASSLQNFFYFILPIIFPGILNAFTLVFSRSITEFGSIVMISSNVPFQDLVGSVLISQHIEQYDTSGASAIALTLLILVCFILFLINFIFYFLFKLICFTFKYDFIILFNEIKSKLKKLIFN